MDNITGMSIQEYAAMRELECEHKKGWGSTTALWVIAAVIVIAFFVYSWHNSCNERTQFAVGLANLTGRVNCMEPDVRWGGREFNQRSTYNLASTQVTVDETCRS